MINPAKNDLFERLHAALPQTQCTRCGYADCAGYAQAIASGDVAINQCPPGGLEGVARLAAITGFPALQLNPANGMEAPRSLAIIDEAWCIGCTLCIKACPTDAIVGSNKMMHTVIEPYCTGCELCVPVCPVDCISLENLSGERTGWQAWSQAEAKQALKRYEFHSVLHKADGGQRPETAKKNEKYEQGEKTAAQTVLSAATQPAAHTARPESDPAVADKKRAVIEAALARARAQRPVKNG